MMMTQRYSFVRRNEGGYWALSRPMGRRVAYVERNGPGWLAVSVDGKWWATGRTRMSAVANMLAERDMRGALS